MHAVGLVAEEEPDPVRLSFAFGLVPGRKESAEQSNLGDVTGIAAETRSRNTPGTPSGNRFEQVAE